MKELEQAIEAAKTHLLMAGSASADKAAGDLIDAWIRAKPLVMAAPELRNALEGAIATRTCECSKNSTLQCIRCWGEEVLEKSQPAEEKL